MARSAVKRSSPENNKPQASNENQKYYIIPCGDGLFAFSKYPSILEARIISVMDVGSNSVKLRTYENTLPVATEIKTGEFDSMCGLADGMKPNDMHATLSPHGLEIYYNEALPGCAAAVERTQPDTIIVMCTEAVRAANKNPDQEPVVRKLIRETAKALGIDPRAVNIISKAMEAWLAGEGQIYAHPNYDGYLDTTGGGSRELAYYEHGRTQSEWLATTRIGTRTLNTVENPRALIEEEYKRAPWFTSQPLHDETGRQIKPDTSGKILGMQGGAFRIVARILAQRIYFTDFRSQMPLQGHTFANDTRLDNELRQMQTATHGSLLDECMRFEYRERKTLKKRDGISEPDYQKWKGNRMASNSFAAWLKKFDKRIGQRIDFLRGSIDIILADKERVNPAFLNFGIHSIREGFLRYSRRWALEKITSLTGKPLSSLAREVPNPRASVPAPNGRKARAASLAAPAL